MKKTILIPVLLVLAGCVPAFGQSWLLRFNTADPGPYPEWCAGLTIHYTDDRGNAQTLDSGAHWCYGPQGSQWCNFNILTTNAVTVSVTYNPPCSGPASVSLPKAGSAYQPYDVAFSPNGSTAVPTTTNVTLCLTNATAGQTCSFVWTFNGSRLDQADNVCATNADCRTATVHLDAQGNRLDTFTAYTANWKSSITNQVVTLANPAGSGQIQNFQWFVNGLLVKEIDHVCPGIAQACTVTIDTCNGSYRTQQVNAGPASTNMNMTVSNPSTAQTMNAYWMANGQLLVGMTLLPGASYTYNQTFDLCGNPNLNLQWGGTLNNGGGSNPGNSPWDGLTNMFGLYTNSLGGFGGTTRAGGGTGDTGTGTGSGSTGAMGGTGGTGGTSNPGQPLLTNLLGGMVYTNNINWPAAGGGTNSGGTGSTAGLALDATVRAGFGQLHQDNGQLLQGLGTLDRDLNNDLTHLTVTNGSMVGVGSNVWVMNQITTTNLESLVTGLNTNLTGNFSLLNTMTTVITNELGQLVMLQWALSNDLMQVVRAITNNTPAPATNDYAYGIYTNTLSLNQNQQTYQGTFTNELGQVIAYEAVMSNELLVITKELTNLPAATNPVTVTVNTSSNLWVANWPTNQPYPTNIWVANMPTNFGAGSNAPFTLTNYALESTLEGISNLLASLLTNGISSNDINAEAARGAAAAMAGSNIYGGMFAGVDSTPAYAANGTYGGNAATWVIQIPYGRGYAIDLNPFHVAWVSDLAVFVRNLVKWISIAGLLLLNIRDVLGAQNAVGAARQATAAGETILGTNANTVIALLCAAAITLAVLALPAFAAGWFTSYISAFATNPFNGVSGTVGTSVWMVDQFFPIGVLVACVFCRAIFTAALSAVVWTVQTIVRFICG